MGEGFESIQGKIRYGRGVVSGTVPDSRLTWISIRFSKITDV